MNENTGSMFWRLFKKNIKIFILRILLKMFTAGFDFICFCIGYLGMAFFMANFVFTDNPLTYFDFMLVTCPLTHYFLYRNKIENEQKNIINRLELKEEIERLKSLTGKK